MKDQIGWLNDALAVKGIAREMTHYRVQDRTIRATDGRLTAGLPFDCDGNFLVPGRELAKLLSRMPNEPELTLADGTVTVRSGRFRGTITTLPPEQWDYPGVDASAWLPLPPDLPVLLRSLRPFVSDNAIQAWAMGVALEGGWCYATNNVVLAGAPCAGLGDASVILPVWAIDFLLSRTDSLVEWMWAPTYVAFRWDNGAWMRSNLIDGIFHERAAAMVRAAAGEAPTMAVTDEFRAAFERVSGLAENLVTLYADHIEAGFGAALVREDVPCEVPAGGDKSLWAARFLTPVLEQATYWQPSLWPKPVPFKGERIVGYVAGRNA